MERYVAFAFAAAEMLVEADCEGRIIFATGALRARLSLPPEAVLGIPVADLIALKDRVAFQTALAMLPLRGRLEPTSITLSDDNATPFVVSGLYLDLPGHPTRLCLSFAPPPVPMAPDTTPRSAAAMLREVEGRIRRAATDKAAAPPDRLGLIEISGTACGTLLPQINQVLERDGGALATEVAPGRFSVLPNIGTALPDLSGLGDALDAMMPNHGLRDAVRIDTLPLSMAGLSPVQSARAMRYCLSVFASGGSQAVYQEGFGAGLAGFVDDVALRSQSLRRALESRSFNLVFQPICALEDGRLHHYEALLRPHKGILGPNSGPAEFVNLAEMVGLTEELDLAVLDLAMQATPQLNAGEHIAVNISGLSMQSMAFRSRLRAALDSAPRAAARLMVELTESAEIEHEAAARDTMQELRGRGVPLCLDDFGAGAAAFRYLRSFPIDYVKIDGSFVAAAMQHETDRSFIAAMVDLSLAVGAKVIAESIETAEQASLMKRLGANYGQGWHLGR
ncbi:MAG: EAL domain-containing protein, partial [Rhodospirillales bacterium]|nr:EAL domain-containing protein [Rhodospirillales bacterium]